MALKDLRKIEDSEVSDKRIHQLRVRPNQRSIYGAPGLTGKELQEKYDEYAELLRQRFNELVETISESLKKTDENGSQIAEEIMVLIENPLSGEKTVNSLANIIQWAYQTAINADAIASQATEKAKTANDNANIAKKESDASAKKSEEALLQSDIAFTRANTAIAKLEDVEAMARGARAGIGFKTVEAMRAFINSQYFKNKNLYIDIELTDSYILRRNSYVVISADFDTVEYTDEEGITHYLSPSSIEFYANNPENIYPIGYSEVTIDSNRIYTIFRVINECPASDIVFNGFFNQPNDYHREYFDGNLRIVNIDHEVPKYSEYTAYDIPYAAALNIEQKGVPDYWWTGKEALESEAAKIDYEEYAKKEFVASNYVKKETGNNMGVYVHDYNSSTGGYVDKIMRYSSSAGPHKWYFVQRDGDGLIQTAGPIKDLHVANKRYVDNIHKEINARLDEIESQLSLLLGG